MLSSVQLWHHIMKGTTHFYRMHVVSLGTLVCSTSSTVLHLWMLGAGQSGNLPSPKMFPDTFQPLPLLSLWDYRCLLFPSSRCHRKPCLQRATFLVCHHPSHKPLFRAGTIKIGCIGEKQSFKEDFDSSVLAIKFYLKHLLWSLILPSWERINSHRKQATECTFWGII